MGANQQETEALLKEHYEFRSRAKVCTRGKLNGDLQTMRKFIIYGGKYNYTYQQLKKSFEFHR